MNDPPLFFFLSEKLVLKIIHYMSIYDISQLCEAIILGGVLMV